MRNDEVKSKRIPNLLAMLPSFSGADLASIKRLACVSEYNSFSPGEGGNNGTPQKVPMRSQELP
jgi:hypothetical protein